MIGSVWLILLINFLGTGPSMGIFVDLCQFGISDDAIYPNSRDSTGLLLALIPVDQMANWLQWIAHIFPLYGGNA